MKYEVYWIEFDYFWSNKIILHISLYNKNSNDGVSKFSTCISLNLGPRLKELVRPASRGYVPGGTAPPPPSAQRARTRLAEKYVKISGCIVAEGPTASARSDSQYIYVHYIICTYVVDFTTFSSLEQQRLLCFVGGWNLKKPTHCCDALCCLSLSNTTFRTLARPMFNIYAFCSSGLHVGGWVEELPDNGK